MNPTIETVPAAPAFAEKATDRSVSVRLSDLWTLTKPGITVMVAITAVSLIAYAQTAAANREAATANTQMENALAAEMTQRAHAETTA